MKKMYTLKQRLITFILIIIIIYSVICIFLFSIFMYNNDQYNTLMDNVFEYTTLSHEINQAYLEFDIYVQNPAEDTLSNYSDSLNSAFASIARIKQSSVPKDIYYSVVGVEELLVSYSELNGQISDRLQTTSFTDIYPLFTESQTIYQYINNRLTTITKSQSAVSKESFYTYTQTAQLFIYIIILLLIGLSVFILLLGIRFSRRISIPIVELTNYAEKITVGNFDTKDLSLKTSNEIEILTVSLNKMKNEIREMFNAIKEKSLLEAKLKETELENLKILNELKNTEIRVLQAQINPHFLYNTLNSISRLAYLNDNQEIVTLIESLSEMLRYNLNKIDRSITLREEIENLKNYIYIQQIRFGQKLKINFDITTAHPDTPMPCLILQPLVENSIIHGLKPYDYSGEINIKIYDEDGDVIVEIQDNGVGISAETMQDLSKNAYQNDDTQQSGIGFQNVMARLKDFYKSDSCISVRSKEGEGTTITLRFPFGR